LFIGNLSRYVKYEDLRDEFEAKGPCKVRIRVS
jgi:RNA recognition motif-containing protein